MTCYSCGTTLNQKNRSAEHIIPNAIGGKKKAYNLLCSECNKHYGQTIDQALANQLGPFGYLLNIPLDRGQHSKAVKLVTASGKGTQYTEEPTNQQYYLAAEGDANPFEIVIGGIDYHRSVAKICLNFYLSKGYPKKYSEKVIAFVKGESKDRIFHYYFPSNEVVHALGEQEVSHIIHLHGDRELGVLYAYIELFNMQNLIMIFSYDYDGNDINVTYCRDVVKNVELTKTIRLGLLRHHLESLRYTSAAMGKKMELRLERLIHIINKAQLSN